MQNLKRFSQSWMIQGITVMTVSVLAGCQSGTSDCCATKTEAPVASTATAAAATPVSATAAPVAVAPKPAVPAVRIKAGPSDPFKDSAGNQWLVDQNFADGDTVDRPDLQIANTKDQTIYRSERYSMSSFSRPLANGKYTVKLHFAETFEGITAPGERVFSFNVEGKQFNDFDVWAKAGGPLRAYIETVDVDVTDGKLDITFTPKVENPEINGIEIIPQS